MSSMNPFAARNQSLKNELMRSCGALLGITQGLLADGELQDREVTFLHDWLTNNQTIATTWPGDVLYLRVRKALEDGVIKPEERQHLVDTLQQLVGGTLDDLADNTHTTTLSLDTPDTITFQGASFCLTGEFVMGPRATCAGMIEARGGTISAAVSKKTTYVIIGGLGSPEWKHGSFGTKVEKAMQLKQGPKAPLVIHEDTWANALGKTQ